MNKTRVIPVLLLRGQGLVKTVKFKNPIYIGDPINSVRIFNEKEVDELIFLDIYATTEGRGPDFDILSDIASEAFMPMAYGGGISNINQIEKIFTLGFEKVVINSASYNNLDLIQNASKKFGAQSIVGCVDVHRTLLGRYELYSNAGKTRQSKSLIDHVIFLEQQGVGEIIINAIDRDGTQSGYDLKMVSEVARSVKVPVVACGGAGSLDHMSVVVREAGATAVAAGSFFVFVGPHRAVLINYPSREQLAQFSP